MAWSQSTCRPTPVPELAAGGVWVAASVNEVPVWASSGAAATQVKTIAESKFNSAGIMASHRSEQSGRDDSPDQSGPLGILRPRCAMMFFWICEVPPPIIRPIPTIRFIGQ